MLDLGRAEEYCGSSWWVATALDTRPHAGRTAMGGFRAGTAYEYLPAVCSGTGGRLP